jgi:hypothetical protein
MGTGSFFPGSPRVSGLRRSSQNQAERDLSRTSIFGTGAGWATAHRSNFARNSNSSLEDLQEGREGDIEEGRIGATGGGSTEGSSQQYGAAASRAAMAALRRSRR